MVLRPSLTFFFSSLAMLVFFLEGGTVVALAGFLSVLDGFLAFLFRFLSSTAAFLDAVRVALQLGVNSSSAYLALTAAKTSRGLFLRVGVAMSEPVSVRHMPPLASSA